MKTKTDIKDILQRLNLPSTGRWDGGFYVIRLENSDEYAKMYSQLDQLAQSQEYPQFETNEHQATVKAVHYFTLDEQNDTWAIFLVANFATDTYYIKLKEDELDLAAKDGI